MTDAENGDRDQPERSRFEGIAEDMARDATDERPAEDEPRDGGKRARRPEAAEPEPLPGDQWEEEEAVEVEGRRGLDFADADPDTDSAPERTADEAATERHDDEEGVPAAAAKRRAREEHERLMRDLYDPMGAYGEGRGGGVDTLSDLNEEVEDEDSEVWRDLADTPGEAVEREESEPERGRFARVVDRARSTLEERSIQGNVRHAQAIGGVLILLTAATATIHSPPVSREIGLTPEPHEVVVRKSNFEPVHEIAYAPTRMLTSGPPEDGGPGWRAGAIAGSRQVLEESYQAVTDAEARLAIAAAGVEHALVTDDLAYGHQWLHRLEYVPGSEADARAARLRARLYGAVATRAARQEDETLEREMRQARALEQGRAEEGERRVQGEGWTAPVAYQLQRALESIARDVSIPTEGNYRGWEDAFNAAMNAFNRKSVVMQAIIRNEARLR